MNDLPTPTTQPLNLRTLNQQPTWHNRARRTDRSATLELRASDIWPLIPHQSFKPKHRKPPHAKGTLVAIAHFTITTNFVKHIHQNKMPFQLRGDLRTQKSNALKNPTPTAIQTNPNRGACTQKILGLPLGFHPIKHDQLLWTQTLTIQKWKYQLNRIIKTYHGYFKDKRTQHYLQCPTCNPDSTSSPQSLRKYSPKKYSKLYLPLCTKEEIHDAEIAQSFLTAHLYNNPRRRNQPPTQFEMQLINRYATLFHPRQFQCRKCQNLRYGELKKKTKPK